MKQVKPVLTKVERSRTIEWLESFAKAVRDRDYNAGRELMDDSCVGFGTVAERVISLDELVEGQWRRVWGRTIGFAFDLDNAVIHTSDEFIVCCSMWQSEGIDKERGNYLRRGRSTIVLRVDGPELKGIHTHFSVLPGTRS
ncbi:MAG: nuclear transport factor 2 family protein [Planctomycetota bacterium]